MSFSMWQERTADENGEKTVKGKSINHPGLSLITPECNNHESQH